MLVLSRRKSQQIIIDDGKITITVVEIRGNKVRLGIEADKSIPILRGELLKRNTFRQGCDSGHGWPSY